jgi:hypothetical protein
LMLYLEARLDAVKRAKSVDRLTGAQTSLGV